MNIFEDRFEDWEQNAIDGTGPGPRSVSDYKRNTKTCISWTSKDPDGDTQYYEGNGDPVAHDEWEHRKIFGLIWENRKGWRLETRLCSNPSGTSDHYTVDPAMIQMIKESNRNFRVSFRSDM